MSSRNEWVLSGSGNAFVVVDGRGGGFMDPGGAAKERCARLDVDGLLLMEASGRALLRMRIFNPDGSEAEMCGNGSRCAAWWAYHVAGVRGAPLTIETVAGLLEAAVNGDSVKVRMTDPRGPKGPLDLTAAGKNLRAHWVDTGVPHAVVEAQGLEALDVERIGRAVRNHPLFAPRGVNATFFERKNGECAARTYERGVEAETRACGTGAVACAVVAAFLYALRPPVRVNPRSGETLEVYFCRHDSGFTEVYLEGPVRVLEKG